MHKADLAPDFTLPDNNGILRSLSEFLAEGPVVLFFYPAAMTPGCTTESCRFRDLGNEFKEVGAHQIGISGDSIDKQAQFSGKYGFDYPLLSDVDGTVSQQFGVRRYFGPLRTKRHTFIIDTDRRVLEVIKSELRMNAHADKALKVLRSLTSY